MSTLSKYKPDQNKITGGERWGELQRQSVKKGESLDKRIEIEEMGICIWLKTPLIGEGKNKIPLEHNFPCPPIFFPFSPTYLKLPYCPFFHTLVSSEATL